MFVMSFVVSVACAVPVDFPRPEHPRPDRVRPVWLNLNGPWDFSFDDGDKGLNEQWQLGGRAFDKTIQVPFPYQAPLSGIGNNDLHRVLWYHRAFSVPEAFSGQRVLLHFGAVDYEAQVWLNGKELGRHRGGHVPFSLDITGALVAGENEVTLRVVDTESKLQPRGKQFWEETPEGIWYTRTSGIWQTVWLEAVGSTYLEDIRITPRIDANAADIEVAVNGSAPQWQVRIEARDRKTGEVFRAGSSENVERFSLALGDHVSLWSPEEPNLYECTVTLYDPAGETPLDSVETYFGMRNVSIAGGKLCLNNQPYYQKLVLDQGYWPEGVMTAPSDAALRYDVEMAKAFGFNGARKHMKVEDPRWLYWADTLGFLVWGEMAAQHGPFQPEMEAPFLEEWLAAVRRDYSHPCIVSWTPFNETWGIEGAHIVPRVQRFVERVYAATKVLDPFRPICDNSGWDHVLTDIADYHDYAPTGADLARRFAITRESHYFRLQEGRFMFFVDGKSYGGQPIVLSEFGGIGLKTEVGRNTAEGAETWAYGAAEADIEAFLARVKEQIGEVLGIDELAGYCYTQLTDVGQEMNGFLTYDRKVKLDPARVAEIQGAAR